MTHDSPERFPARRSGGGEAALWVAGGLLFLALAALVFGGSRQPGTIMLLLCVLAAILAAAGTGVLVLAIGYQRFGFALPQSSLRLDWLRPPVGLPLGARPGRFTRQPP